MTFDVFLYAGIESFSKLGDSIYFEGKGTIPSLYIIQYISSSFSWRAAGIQLNQKTRRVYNKILIIAEFALTYHSRSWQLSII